MFLSIKNEGMDAARCQTMPHIRNCYKMYPGGVSTQLKSSGLVAYENSTFWDLALVDSVSFMV